MKNKLKSNNPFDDNTPPPIQSNAPNNLPNNNNSNSNVNNNTMTLPIATPIVTNNLDSTITTTTTSSRPLSITLDGTMKFKVIALYDHESDAEDELSFQIHDIIEVIDDTDEGWWFGKNIKSNRVGLFPANYTKRL